MMTRFKIKHTTRYDYTENVPLSTNQARLSPREHPFQSCEYFRLAVRPRPVQITKQTDYFGNTVHHFEVAVGHKALQVTTVSRISIIDHPQADLSRSASWEQVREELASSTSRESLAAYQFAFPSPHAGRFDELGAYARESFGPAKPIGASLLDLTARIHRDFTYDPNATTVSTPVEEVFRNRRGVCQDLAHVQIAALRSIGLAARYVSGYVRTIPPDGQSRLVGADASHAWLSLYCGSFGWIDVDPTNNLRPASDHITVAWGRDYGDVCPIHGLYLGGGSQTINVAVRVLPL